MNPEASFDEIHARGRLENLKIHRTVYGRARSNLGLAVPKRRATAKTAENGEVAQTPQTNGVPAGLPEAGLANLPNGMDLPADFTTMVQTLRETLLERDRYAVLMETLQRLCEEALGKASSKK